MTDWQIDAACRAAIARGEAEQSWWFPEVHQGHLGARARAICETCPVIQECLEASGRQEGIWGGLNTRKRRGIASTFKRCSRCKIALSDERAKWCEVCRVIVHQEQKNESRRQRKMSA